MGQFTQSTFTSMGPKSTSVDGELAVRMNRLKLKPSALQPGKSQKRGVRHLATSTAFVLCSLLICVHSMAAETKKFCDSIVPETIAETIKPSDFSREFLDPVGVLENLMSLKQKSATHAFQRQVLRFEKSEANGLRSFLHQPTSYAYRDAIFVERPYISEVDFYINARNEILKLLKLTQQKISDRQGKITDAIDLLEMKVKPMIVMMTTLIHTRQSAIDSTDEHAREVAHLQTLTVKDFLPLPRTEASDLQYLILSRHVQNEIIEKDNSEAELAVLSSLERRTPDQSLRLEALQKELNQRKIDLFIRLTMLDQAHRVYFDESVRDIAGEVKTVGLSLAVGYQKTRELKHPDPRFSPLAKKLPQQTLLDYLVSQILVRPPMKTQVQKRELH